ncbi:MAG: GNAT family N-acetyltransferase [Anaerolineae bacterium]|nr:GNAT family N-acetyltransferase [Anaerolineae bacterium]
MPEFFNDLSTEGLIKVIDENLIERSLRFSQLLGGNIHGPNPEWFITGTAMPTTNGVVRAKFEKGTIDEQIKAALTPFKARKLPMTWWVGPTSAPGNLGKHLQRHGLKHNRDMIGMAIDMDKLELPPTPLPGLEFEYVTASEALSQWYEVLLQGFPTTFNQNYLNALAKTTLAPETGSYNYIARQNGKILTVSTISLGGGAAGLYNLATLPSARKQGLGAWMTIKSFLEARAMGYRVGTLQTTYPNALRMYHQMGFEVYCKIGVYNYKPIRKV